MAQTLADLKLAAEQRFAQGRHIDALKVYRLMLEAIPLDFSIRMAIGDLFAATEKTEFALAIYQAAATHYIKSGDPLAAVVAIKLLEKNCGKGKNLVASIAQIYSAESDSLGRGVRQAPQDYTEAVRDGLDLDYEIDDVNAFTLQTARLAADLSVIQNYPNMVPPVPIFSSLKRKGFQALLQRLNLIRHKPDEAVITQGLVGNAVYFLASGHVKATRDNQNQDGETERVVLAGLGPGSLFGEMALVSNEPRSASIFCSTPVDVLELKRDQVEQLATELPEFAVALANFTQERMIQNMLRTNPLFSPFDDDQRKNLLGRFTGHDVPKGTIFLEQGTQGPGLYLLLRGRAEVLIWDGGEYVKVADLGPGEAAGEISLLHETAVSATCRTTTDATLLFLARELFSPLVDQVPDLLAHFNRMAERRIADTEQKMAAWHVEQEVEELDDSDLELSQDDTLFL